MMITLLVFFSVRGPVRCGQNRCTRYKDSIREVNLLFKIAKDFLNCFRDDGAFECRRCKAKFLLRSIGSLHSSDAGD